MLTEGQINETLAIMHERGAGWLADILTQMVGGDPWQEGLYAREILEAYRKHELKLEA